MEDDAEARNGCLHHKEEQEHIARNEQPKLDFMPHLNQLLGRVDHIRALADAAMGQRERDAFLSPPLV